MRVVIVSAEHDARLSALVQADVQATMPQASVLVIRPVAFNFNIVAQGLARLFGNAEIDFNQFSGINQEDAAALAKTYFDPVLAPSLDAVKEAPV